MTDLSIIIVNYKSTEKTLNFIKNIPKKYNIIIVDNSGNGDLFKKIIKKDNIKILETENNGYGSAINKGRKEINSKYFFAFSPDVQGVNSLFFEKFEDVINTELKFGAIGPRFINVSEKSHNQSDIKKKIGQINAISGSAIFFDTKAFDEINGFDEKIFLFFEENDLCARLVKKKYKIYQLNEVKVFHPKGVKKGVVKLDDKNIYTLQNFYGWHYMWSKFYHFKKNKISILAYIYFIPIILKICARILIYKIFRSKNKRRKYQMRFKGLLNSILNKPSYKRINL